MDLQRILFVALRKWWLVFALMTLGGAMGFLTVYFGVPRYQAETKLYIMQSDQEIDEALSIEDFTLSRYLVEQYSNIISTRTVEKSIIDKVGVDDLNEKKLQKMVELITREDSNIFNIRATGSDPQVVAAVANATAAEFTEELNKITKNNAVGILDEALVPRTIETTYVKVRILFGTLIGLMLAFSIIFFIEFFKTPIRSVEDIEDGVGLRVIGQIPDYDIR